jgi:predicted alpha-1,2-mannosidase
VNDSELEGMRITGSFCYNAGSERPVFFVTRFSKKAAATGVWKKMPHSRVEQKWSRSDNRFKLYENFRQEIAGDSIGAWFQFETSAGETIIVKTGVSYVSIENARKNLLAESEQHDFEILRINAENAWNATLSKVRIEGGTQDEKTVFYTALYHTQLHPNIISDVNGDYPAMESEKTGNTAGFHYSIFSLWDTYRNLHPLMSLLYPRKQLDMVKTMIRMYKESGWLPKWELNGKETFVMEGDPAIPVIVDTYRRGLTDFEIQTAYEAMYKSATSPGRSNKLRPDIDSYLKRGYIPYTRPFDNSVSHALEYYIADWNLAQLAKMLGKADDYERFLAQSLRYVEYFDFEEYKMIRPKLADGTFLKPFDPEQGENFQPSPGFHEGSAWQYTFGVPHDIRGLIRHMGGEKHFINKLQRIFDDDLYDMTNEPDIHYPYLFNYVSGEAWRTQRIVDDLRKTHFKNAPDGIPGNDDCGTLSAWIIFSMLGFYPVCPGSPEFAVTSPLFEKIELHLDQTYYPGQCFEIQRNTEGNRGPYIKSMTLNGKPFTGHFLHHDVITEGGYLQIETGSLK